MERKRVSKKPDVQVSSILTFMSLGGNNNSAILARTPGSILRALKEAVIMLMSNCSLRIREWRNDSVPRGRIETGGHNLISGAIRKCNHPPSSRRLRSKLVLRSKILESWDPVTTLNICRCRYSRCNRLLRRHSVSVRPCARSYQAPRRHSLLIPALPTRKRKRSKAELAGGK